LEEKDKQALTNFITKAGSGKLSKEDMQKACDAWAKTMVYSNDPKHAYVDASYKIYTNPSRENSYI